MNIGCKGNIKENASILLSLVRVCEVTVSQLGNLKSFGLTIYLFFEHFLIFFAQMSTIWIVL